MCDCSLASRGLWDLLPRWRMGELDFWRRTLRGAKRSCLSWSSRLWWLISCVYLTVLRMPDSWWTSFLGVSLRVFMEEVSIGFSGLSEEIWAQQCELASSYLLGQKGEWRAASLCLFELGCPSSPALGHQRSHLDWIAQQVFLALQLADSSWWDL